MPNLASAIRCCSGVTGSGKTFTMAKVIEALQRPALILAPNKTLAAQLYRRDEELLPGKRGGVFRLLLRLLPAGSLYPAHRHLYREGFLGQRGDRPHAPFGDAGDPGARRRDHRRLRLLHLRHRLGGDLFRHGGHASKRGQRLDRMRSDARSCRRCNTGATTTISRAARSACAATPSICSRRITKTAPGASSCSATWWTRSPNSIR